MNNYSNGISTTKRPRSAVQILPSGSQACNPGAQTQAQNGTVSAVNGLGYDAASGRSSAPVRTAPSNLGPAKESQGEYLDSYSQIYASYGLPLPGTTHAQMQQMQDSGNYSISKQPLPTDNNINNNNSISMSMSGCLSTDSMNNPICDSHMGNFNSGLVSYSQQQQSEQKSFIHQTVQPHQTQVYHPPDPGQMYPNIGNLPSYYQQPHPIVPTAISILSAPVAQNSNFPPGFTPMIAPSVVPIAPATQVYSSSSKSTHVALEKYLTSHAPLGSSQASTYTSNNSNTFASVIAHDSHFSSILKQRRGRWTPEEEAYAQSLIKEFEAGMLDDCENGTTLRSYLSRKLHCAPMRISKKFAGELVFFHVC